MTIQPTGFGGGPGGSPSATSGAVSLTKGLNPFLTALGIFNVGTQAVSLISESRDQAEAFAYNAAISRQNAKLIRQAGEATTQRMKEEKKRAVSSQITSFAKSGVKFSGTPLAVIADTNYQFDMDIASTLFNAEVSARTTESQATLEDHRAEMTKSKGEADALAAILGGAFDLSFKSGLIT